MTLRITPVPGLAAGTLRLEGHLGAAEVPELERSARTGVGAVDLSDLRSADHEGLAALRRLRERGLEIRNASRYLTMVLD
jgi:ABC-type transporter Mla MlaB component